MSFSSLRFGQFCDFRPKVCFPASGSKRFQILSFSFSSLTLSHFSQLSQRYFNFFFFFCYLTRQSVFFTKRPNTPEKDEIDL
ncbi:hypothetical protein Hanom_Chr12g01175011 [Helianthus anomalus]